ncbi:hypothetical protein GUJ93_ZPchr0006g42111 [Zizania palustris]|uniref:Uncharacterized protein n=1 Tax=Zizania palustris TaxID=103762 RepID=A0A8J5VJ93_ZIZPA|nr:hypothetical protein GUJ93_ZPchr0006g42111 [Zizania palustris]
MPLLRASNRTKKKIRACKQEVKGGAAPASIRVSGSRRVHPVGGDIRDPPLLRGHFVLISFQRVTLEDTCPWKS